MDMVGLNEGCKAIPVWEQRARHKAVGRHRVQNA